MRLEFEPAAADAYDAITDPDLLGKIDGVLDALEKDPGQPLVRQHRWSDPPLWGVTVRDRGGDVLVLWAPELHDQKHGQETVIVVHYVGPEA